VAEDDDVAAVPVAVPLEDLHRRGLPRPVRPEEPEHLADRNLEVESTQGLDASVRLAQVANRDRSGHIW
jgi:hypothetical protein